MTTANSALLSSYLLDTYSARKLGLRATGHAARETGGGVTVGYTNLYLEPGPHSPEAIIRSVERGLYVMNGAPRRAQRSDTGSNAAHDESLLG